MFGKNAAWTSGDCQYEQVIRAASASHCVHGRANCSPGEGGTSLELAQRAATLEAAHDPGCVDLYFAAAWRNWQCLATLGDLPANSDLLEQSPAYNACLAKLLVTAQKFHRLDPNTGLCVFHEGQQLTIPVELYGFAWSPEDFNQLELVGEYELSKGAKNTRTSGVGVPLVVVRRRSYDEQFFRRIQPFAATAVLRTRASSEVSQQASDSSAASSCEMVLEFYNPARCTHLYGANRRWALAGDLTAPLAWAKNLEPNDPLQAYLRPDSENGAAQLVMLEPYQRGKIPIVFVHGLLSDPTTWVTFGNELTSQPWFRQRYQVWVFRYPSGMPFLVSAATLRRELNAALAASCAEDDPAAQQTVLVGHSMGGLVSKLQVTDAGNELWDIVATRPMDEVKASDTDLQRMREVFFFAPQPFIRHVIFIGTPHQGSSLARRGVGRISSLLAQPTSEADERHRRVVEANPGVFRSTVARRVPTSVDLLEPNNPLLLAMERLTVGPCVQLHTIAGVAKIKCVHGASDGVVPLSSATQACVVSEKLVDATHEELHEAATTLIEIERILQRQLFEIDHPRRSSVDTAVRRPALRD
jgi:hypothetical protein